MAAAAAAEREEELQGERLEVSVFVFFSWAFFAKLELSFCIFCFAVFPSLVNKIIITGGRNKREGGWNRNAARERDKKKESRRKKTRKNSPAPSSLSLSFSTLEMKNHSRAPPFTHGSLPERALSQQRAEVRAKCFMASSRSIDLRVGWESLSFRGRKEFWINIRDEFVFLGLSRRRPRRRRHHHAHLRLPRSLR